MNQDQFQSQLQITFEANKADFCKKCKHELFELAGFAEDIAAESTFIRSVSNCWEIVNYVRKFENDRYVEATDFYYEMTGNVQGIDLDYAIEGVASAIFYLALYDLFADYWDALKNGYAFPEFKPRT